MSALARTADIVAVPAQDFDAVSGPDHDRIRGADERRAAAGGRISR
jgi:hypothetical protein